LASDRKTCQSLFSFGSRSVLAGCGAVPHATTGSVKIASLKNKVVDGDLRSVPLLVAANPAREVGPPQPA